MYKTDRKVFFSKVATSKVYFSKWQLPSCAISQAATSQVYPSQRSAPTAVWELAHLIGKLPVRKLSLGKSPLGKH